MNRMRRCLAAALLAPALPAAAQTCADLGQSYTMYTYSSGDRVGVDSGTSPRRFMVSLDCKYDAAADEVGIELGFARVCEGQAVKVQGRSCKVAKVVSQTERLEADPKGKLVQRRSGARPSLR